MHQCQLLSDSFYPLLSKYILQYIYMFKLISKLRGLAFYLIFWEGLFLIIRYCFWGSENRNVFDILPFLITCLYFSVRLCDVCVTIQANVFFFYVRLWVCENPTWRSSVCVHWVWVQQVSLVPQVIVLDDSCPGILWFLCSANSDLFIKCFMYHH